MKTLNIKQGSQEWLETRGRYHTASEAPAMMGQGAVSRSELVKMKATGSEIEYSQWVEEVLFPRGHAVEAEARPMAEAIVGEELYPVTCVDDDDYLLASLDGMTMDESVTWECKQWNEDKAQQVAQGTLPSADFWQVKQHLLVTGAEKCLYMVTDGTEDRCAYMWVTANSGDFDKLLASWAQFDADVAAYVPQEVTPEPVGRAPEELPALRLEVTGMVTASNLEGFREHALQVFAGISTDLSTDEDFANAEQTVKWCKGVEDKLETAKQHALEQTASIDELFRAIDAIKAEARAKRLELDKAVKARKESIRGEILLAAKQSLTEHVYAIDKSLPAGVGVPVPVADFAGAMKGKRTIASLRDAADTELARCKVEADRKAESVRSNMKIMRELATGHEALFPDHGELLLKEAGDLTAVIKSRIADYEAQEKRKREAEEQRKRDQEAAAEAQGREETAAPAPPQREEEPTPATASATPEPRPSFAEMTQVIAGHYGVPKDLAVAWMIEAVQVEQAA